MPSSEVRVWDSAGTLFTLPPPSYPGGAKSHPERTGGREKEGERKREIEDSLWHQEICLESKKKPKDLPWA